MSVSRYHATRANIHHHGEDEELESPALRRQRRHKQERRRHAIQEILLRIRISVVAPDPIPALVEEETEITVHSDSDYVPSE